MFLLARRKSTHEYGSLCSRCSRKTPLVISRDSNICRFFLAPFSPLSWSLEKQAYLDLKEFWVSYRTEKPYNILASYLFEKALVPSKSKFLPVFHALTVCDTLLRWSWNCQNTDHRFFAIFFVIEMKYFCY